MRTLFTKCEWRETYSVGMYDAGLIKFDPARDVVVSALGATCVVQTHPTWAPLDETENVDSAFSPCKGRLTQLSALLTAVVRTDTLH